MAAPRILIIDDDEGICETLADIFHEKGYRVATVNTGQEAIDIVKTMLFDVALVDIDLPDIKGTSLLRELEKNHPQMACIIITGNNSLDYEIEALKGGASGYFLKPLVLEKVFSTVNEVLDNKLLQKELERFEER